MQDNKVAASAPHIGAVPSAPATNMYRNLYNSDKVSTGSKGTTGVKKTVIAPAIDYDDTVLRHTTSLAALDLWFEGLALYWRLKMHRR